MVVVTCSTPRQAGTCRVDLLSADLSVAALTTHDGLHVTQSGDSMWLSATAQTAGQEVVREGIERQRRVQVDRVDHDLARPQPRDLAGGDVTSLCGAPDSGASQVRGLVRKDPGRPLSAFQERLTTIS
jgi:hypothetical protein